MIILQEAADQFGWQFIKRIESLTSLVDCLVIIIPTWSMKDLNLVEGLSIRINSLGIPVYLLDIDAFRLQEETVEVFGNIPPINQTPVIIKFCNGDLVQIEQGESVTGFFGD